MQEGAAELTVAMQKLGGCLQVVGGTNRLFWELFGSSGSTDTFWLDRCATSAVLAALLCADVQPCVATTSLDKATAWTYWHVCMATNLPSNLTHATRLQIIACALPCSSPGHHGAAPSWLPASAMPDKRLPPTNRRGCSATQDRGRFAFMGGRGGPLWQRITYTCAPSQPLPPSQPPHRPQQGPDGGPGRGTVTTEDVQGRQHRQELPALDAPCSGLYGGSNQAFWAWLDSWLRDRRLGQQAHLQQLPFDFWGGLVGYLGYGLKHQGASGGSPDSPLPQLPDAGLMLADR